MGVQRLLTRRAKGQEIENVCRDFLIKQKITSATLCLPQLAKYSADWQLEQMILQTDNLQYQLLDFKKKKAIANKLEAIHFYLPMMVMKW